MLVTVGLIDGTERHGRAAPLAEGVEDLFVELGDGSVATIPAERVAYVVRHRTLAECPSEGPEGARAYKIHVTPTLHFSVWARAASPR